MTAEEIRADFAQRLKRRMTSMRESTTIPQCDPRMVWEQACRVVELMLAECNGDEDVTEGAEG